MLKKCFKHWYLFLIGAFFVCTAVVYAVFGEGSYLAVHDNLDLFIPQFQMMKDTGSFFAHHVDVPFLGGVSRDNLPSEWSLYSMFFMVLPSYTAYIAGYLAKVAVAVVSVWLLARDWYGEDYTKYRCPVMLMGFAYGILNLFPAFGIPFASIPLVLFLLRRIYKEPKLWLYAALFCYPFLSYFSYFGFFILAYLVVAIIWLGIRDKKVSLPLLLSLFVLGAGYVVFEYRLFGVMLFNHTETIRSTMVEADLTAGEILSQIVDVWKNGMFHAESVHTWFVLPVCVLYFFYRNIRYITEKNVRGIFHDIFNLFMLLLVFNSVIYGIYNWGSFRGLVETVLPPLKGFQFNRTVFFNPFLWYAAFFVILQRMYGLHKKAFIFLANGMALFAVALILLTPTKYNDLYATCRNRAYELIKGKISDDMSYGEFYSTGLFDQIKEDIGYQGEWSAAYGIYPAVLEYNGIATLDGYLGFYSEEYKEDFRKVIAPALEREEPSRGYYDDWGARAYLYSGTDITSVNPSKTVGAVQDCIYIDAQAFEDLGGRYIFSRKELTNAEEAGLAFLKSYASEESPYVIYLYERR